MEGARPPLPPQQHLQVQGDGGRDPAAPEPARVPERVAAGRRAAPRQEQGRRQAAAPEARPHGHQLAGGQAQGRHRHPPHLPHRDRVRALGARLPHALRQRLSRAAARRRCRQAERESRLAQQPHTHDRFHIVSTQLFTTNLFAMCKGYTLYMVCTVWGVFIMCMVYTLYMVYTVWGVFIMCKEITLYMSYTVYRVFTMYKVYTMYTVLTMCKVS